MTVDSLTSASPTAFQSFSHLRLLLEQVAFARAPGYERYTVDVCWGLLPRSKS